MILLELDNIDLLIDAISILIGFENLVFTISNTFREKEIKRKRRNYETANNEKKQKRKRRYITNSPCQYLI